MIGNDVIDIALAKQESNWQRARFLQKIFTKAEQQFILDSNNPELAVWNLWSRKEAAYKILARQTGIRRFIPLQLECSDLEFESVVSYKETAYFTRTKITDYSIYTVAVTAAADLNRLLELPTDTIIVKIDNLPFIKDSKSVLRPVSISHHGQFHNVVMLRDAI